MSEHDKQQLRASLLRCENDHPRAVEVIRAHIEAQEAEIARLRAEVAIQQNNIEAMESCDKSLREYIDTIEADLDAMRGGAE